MQHVELAIRFLQGIQEPYYGLFAVEIMLSKMDMDEDIRLRIRKYAIPPVIGSGDVWSFTVFGSYVDGIMGAVRFDYAVSIPNLNCSIEQ